MTKEAFVVGAVVRTFSRVCHCRLRNIVAILTKDEASGIGDNIVAVKSNYDAVYDVSVDP
jgi:hypothetical protein